MLVLFANLQEIKVLKDFETIKRGSIWHYRFHNGGAGLCDVKKYEKIYEDIKKLQPEDTLQLVLEAETEEQRTFYEMVGDFLLQKKQWQVIERNLLHFEL